jgi:NAD(P)-dependent dehydrogenase (short-subunit alcohol dehydrogenase family)
MATIAPFGFDSTADDVLAGQDLRGRTIVVTGVSAGLGVETARTLVMHGAHVIGTVRDLAKARGATASFADQGGGLELIEMDLASLVSVRAGTDALLARGVPLDCIIGNAGVMAAPLGKTADGFETQFGTNHLGHFVFVNRLAPLLRDGSRVVMLSSAGHRFADVDVDDPNFEHRAYDPWAGYGGAKTSNILFAVEFDRRHRSKGIRATAVHPGSIETELGRHLPPGAIAAARKALDEEQIAQGKGPVLWKTIPQGAATTVWAAIVADADAVGGRYCEDCHVAVFNANPKVRGGVQPYALDPEHAKALWAKSEELVGERF